MTSSGHSLQMSISLCLPWLISNPRLLERRNKCVYIYIIWMWWIRIYNFSKINLGLYTISLFGLWAVPTSDLSMIWLPYKLHTHSQSSIFPSFINRRYAFPSSETFRFVWHIMNNILNHYGLDPLLETRQQCHLIQQPFQLFIFFHCLQDHLLNDIFNFPPSLLP